jgi:anti-anti-sigma regulatory factor
MSFITVSQVKGRVPITIFHLRDRINLGNVGELEQAAREAYANGMRDLLLDLTDVISITSAGLRAIIAISRLLGSTPGEEAMRAGLPDKLQKPTHLKLLKPSPAVREVMAITGMDEYINIYDDMAEAIGSF